MQPKPTPPTVDIREIAALEPVITALREQLKDYCKEHGITETAALQTAEKVLYTINHIHTKIQVPDYVDIMDYIEYMEWSFNETKLLGAFYHYVYQFSFFITPETDKHNILPKIRAALNAKTVPKEQYSEPPFDNFLANIDYGTKWLSLFPFDIPFFAERKEALSQQVKILRNEHRNPYTGVIRYDIIPNNEVIEAITQITLNALDVFRSQSFINGIPVSNEIASILNFAQWEFNTKALRERAGHSPHEYIRILEVWFNDQIQYVERLKIHTTTPAAQLPTATETRANAIKTYFIENGFYELPKVQELQNDKQHALLELICNNQTPYAVALLEVLSFFDITTRKQNKGIKNLCEEINTLGFSDTYRNKNTLNPKSSEDKGRYTAWKHKEQAEKDYATLKK